MYLLHKEEETKRIHTTLTTSLGQHLRKPKDDKPATRRLAELVYRETLGEARILREELEELATAIHWTARGQEQNRSRCDILRSACAAAKAISSTRRRKEKKRLAGDRKGGKQRNTPTAQPKPQLRNETTRGREPEEEDACPKCGRIVLKDNKFCPECGTKAMRQPTRHDLGPEPENLRKPQEIREKDETTRNGTKGKDCRPTEGPNRERNRN
jgi:hypothetical protein